MVLHPPLTDWLNPQSHAICSRSWTSLCIKIPEEKWNFVKLVVGADKSVNAYVNGRLIKTFEAHFTTRGFGGVLAENSFNNIAEFRNFDIAPILPNTYGKF